MVNLKSNLLGENTSKLNLSIEVVVSIEILTEFRRPLSLELLRHGGYSDAVHLDVDLRNSRLILKSPVSSTLNRAKTRRISSGSELIGNWEFNRLSTRTTSGIASSRKISNSSILTNQYEVKVCLCAVPSILSRVSSRRTKSSQTTHLLCISVVCQVLKNNVARKSLVQVLTR